MHKIITSAVAISIALAATAQHASAQLIANYPGALCVATNDDALTVRDDGEAENAATHDVTIACPAERPIGNDMTTTAIGGRVFAVDRSATADVCCRAFSKNPAGAEHSGNPVCSQGAKSTYQILDVPAVIDAKTFSHYFIQCTVPAVSGSARSRIQAYRTIQ